MNKKNRHLLYELLSEAMIFEQEEEDTEKPKEDAPDQVKPRGPQAKTLEGPTDNKLGQGRPPSHVTDTREMAANPTKAKELLKRLGISPSIGGSDPVRAAYELFTAAIRHEDFKRLVTGVSRVNNSAQSKVGVKLDVGSGPMAEDPKAVYFFIRSLFTAAINAGSLNISSADQNKCRLEKATEPNTFVFYKSKNAKNWN
jgi:hypothetical protein